MAVDILSCVPRTIERGTTVRLKLSGSYSAAAWSLALVFNNGIDAPFTVNATTSADGKSFDAVLTTANTAALPLGSTQWGESFTALSGGDVALGRVGATTILPGILATGEPTPAQASVTALESAILKANGKQFLSVSFNGQTHTRFPLGDAQRQLVFWKSRVIAEQAELRRLRGETTGGEIGIAFVGPCGRPHFCG